MIDSFERSSLQYYSLNTDAYSIVSDRATDGSNSLYSSAEADETIETFDGDGLEPLPAPGDTVLWDVYSTGGARTELNFAREDSNNRLVISTDTDLNETYIAGTDGGTWETILYTSVTIPENEWITVELDWESETAYGLTLYNESGSAITTQSSSADTPISAPDPNGMAIVASGPAGCERWVDHIRYEGDGGGGGSEETTWTRGYTQHGAPHDSVTFDSNWSHNPNPPDPNDSTIPENALMQVDHEASPNWDGVSWTNNHYGDTTPPDSSIGIQPLQESAVGIYEGTTDSEGRFDAGSIPNGDYSLTISHPDYVDIEDVVTFSGGTDIRDYQLQLEANAPFTVTVRDYETSERLQDVLVALYRQ